MVKRERESDFPILEDAMQKLINKAYMHHAAFPNWKDGEPELTTLRFFIFDTTFCINGSKKHIDRFENFLAKQGLDINFFKSNFYTEKNDIQNDSGLTISGNRGQADFRYYSKESLKLENRELVSFGSVIENVGYGLAIGLLYQ